MRESKKFCCKDIRFLKYFSFLSILFFIFVKIFIMDNPFTNLEPHKVWQYFYEITQIPRPSKKEDKIIAYLENFAKSKNLEYKKDRVGNIVIRKPANKGGENKPMVALQCHLDMVCEKIRMLT